MLFGDTSCTLEDTLRDREVGGSNPLAPTNNSQSINNIRSWALMARFNLVANLWTKLLDFEVQRSVDAHSFASRKPRQSRYLSRC